jgi:hypothetical protein
LSNFAEISEMVKNTQEETTKLVTARFNESLEEFRSFLALRAELFEIDTRFGEVGSSGIFAALDAAGVLDHGLSGLRDVGEAMQQPPAGGRAHVRGQAILSCCGDPKRYSAGWQQIFDHQLGRVLDLSDPFGRDSTWKPFEDARRASREARSRRTHGERFPF